MYLAELLKHGKSNLDDMESVSTPSLVRTTPAPPPKIVEKPSNLKVQIALLISAKATSPTSPGTSSLIDEASPLGNWAKRSAIA